MNFDIWICLEIGNLDLEINWLMSFFKKTFIISLIAIGILGPVLVLAVDPYGLSTAADQAGLADLAISKKSIPQFAGEVIGVGLSLIGIIFFLLMLYAGLRWMIAMGKSEDVQKAKDTLEAAAIGLVIILAAYAITQFVFTNLGVGEGGGGSNSVPNSASESQNACITDVECVGGSTCVDGICTPQGEFGPPAPPPIVCVLDSQCEDGEICSSGSCGRIDACDSVPLQTECVGLSTCEWKDNPGACECKNMVEGQSFPICSDFPAEDLCYQNADDCFWQCGNCQAKKRN